MNNGLDQIIASVFSNIDSIQRTTLIEVVQTISICDPVILSKGDVIYTKRENINSAFFLVEGLVRVFDQTDNHDINLRLLCDGSLVLPMYTVAQHWQIASHQISAVIATETAEAITQCTGFHIPLSAFNDLGIWGDKLKLELTIRHYRSMEERLRMLQLQTAYQRYETFVNTAPKKIIEQMPSLHIASYLGITPETLSRIKRQYNTRD